MRDPAPRQLVDERAQEDVLIVRLLLLHGFTATGRGWDPLRRHLDRGIYDDVAAPDLRGHGDATDRLPATIDACAADLRQTAPYALAGYSMGGRIALHLALTQPDLVERLILISTTAGIEDAAARAERRANDDELAEGLERAGLEPFVKWWGGQSLFAGQSPEVSAAARRDRQRNTAAGLAASLRGMGTGAMVSVWDRLGELTMPVTVVVGERDAKFRAIGERLERELPAARLVVIPGAGHAVHLEAPEAVAAAINAAEIDHPCGGEPVPGCG